MHQASDDSQGPELRGAAWAFRGISSHISHWAACWNVSPQVLFRVLFNTRVDPSITHRQKRILRAEAICQPGPNVLSKAVALELQFELLAEFTTPSFLKATLLVCAGPQITPASCAPFLYQILSGWSDDTQRGTLSHSTESPAIFATTLHAYKPSG